MANPQLEDGYIRIANELWEALGRFRIPGEAMLVLNCIIRKTYGYGKLSDVIPLSQFVSYTLMSRAHICRAIKTLESCGIIIANKGTSNATNYKVNKNFDTWKSLPKKGLPVPKLATGSPHIGNKPVPILGHSKDIKTITKNNIAGSAKIASPATRFLHDFGTLFQDKFGCKYFCNFKKDTTLAKSLTTAFDYDDLIRRVKAFLNDEDEFIKKAGYTVGTFQSKVNKYVVKRYTPLKEWHERRMTPEERAESEQAKQKMLETLRQKGILRNGS